MRKKKKTEEKVMERAERYGSGFWIGAMLTALFAGLAAIAVGTLAMMRVKTASNPLSWLAVFFFSALVMGAAYGSTQLFGVWGMMIRRLRLMEERFRGAMSISSINAYEERENKRKNDMETVVSDNMGNIRTAINENMTKYKTDMAEYYRWSQKELQELRSEMKKRNALYERQRLEDIENRRRDAAVLENIVSMLNSGRGRTVEELRNEEQRAFESEKEAEKPAVPPVEEEIAGDDEDDDKVIGDTQEYDDPAELMEADAGDGEDTGEKPSAVSEIDREEEPSEQMEAEKPKKGKTSGTRNKKRMPVGGEDYTEDEALFDSY